MIRLMRNMTKKDFGWFIFCVLLTIAQSACDLAQPFVLSNVANSSTIAGVWSYAGVMIALSIISFILGSAVIFTSARLSVRVCGNIRYKLFCKIQTLTSPEIDKITTPSLITRITNDISFYQNTLVLILRMIGRSICLFLGGIIASFIYCSQLQANDANGNINLWWLAFVVLGCLFVLALIILIVIYFTIPYFSKQQKEIDKTNAVMRENILGVKVVKAFNLQNEQMQVFDKQNKELKKVSTIGQTIGLSAHPLMQFFVQGSIVLLLLVAAIFMSYSGSINNVNGIVLSFLQMVSLIAMGLILSVVAMVNIGQTKVCANRILEVFDTQRLIPVCESENYVNNSTVEFKNVNFKYYDNPDSLNVLDNITFDAQPGEVIGIIGPTGSGKTTLVNLITRQYDVNEGEIKISGFNVKEINSQSLSDSIGYATQKSILFSGTIKSNLLFGKSDATEQELIEAAKNAEAYEFIKKKENNFDSHVDQRAGNFSGGQKQRLAIARALIRKPKILILDDATSALDMITEAKVQQNIRTLTDSTIFLIGQRISAISKADKIIVLDQGKMVGYGNHEHLLKNCALYKEIADSQAMSVEG